MEKSSLPEKIMVPTFSPAKNWVEEDFFTQQEKYCERDSIFVEKSKKF